MNNMLTNDKSLGLNSLDPLNVHTKRYKNNLFIVYSKTDDTWISEGYQRLQYQVTFTVSSQKEA